ncbi:hypothetical protein PV332_10370 [Streptomyces scabiei]|nr:hypothetical protein [Streptomyces scabiei]MDX2575884.1 hypothetical protein [Streptomyces scabiei]MDX2885643.1 hypothetical protein [Streptomyces scabiei]MDX2997649.1 hypothetical protein [Streptomyces scabiei]MDX3032930.1 hypothetical protein [Streptomyces scabiei]MDX3051271.1 hypothetical protein [Streptomyces scabiei]
MCAHPDHKVVTLPDGQVAETHVISAEDMARMVEALCRHEPMTFIDGRNY